MLQRYASLKTSNDLLSPYFLLLLLVASTLCSSAQTYTTVGTLGTVSLAGSGPNPFVAVDNTSRGTRQQYIIRGQELLDAGIPANAQIVSVGFNIMTAATSAGNVQNLSNWSLTLFSNSNSASTSPLGSWVDAPVVASSTPSTLNVGTTGWKHTTFTTPYIWTGGSANNLIVQACYNNASTNANNTNSHARVQRTTNLSTAAGVRSRWLIGNATSGICENTTSFATTNEFLRPLVQIGWILEPTPGNTLAAVNPVACGTTALSLQNPGTGFTYQWQSSPDNASWTDIGGATAATYSATPAASTWYRCVVSLGGNPVNSTPVLVTVTAPNPGATTGPSTVDCVAANLALQTAQVSGITYSWEHSTNGDVNANYTTTGVTSATYSTVVLVPTWFRCLVSCPTTGLSTYSTPLLVTPIFPNAGDDATLTLCNTADPVSMFDLLGNEAEVGGTWTGPSPVVNGTFDPATMVGGVYTYSVAGTAPCPNATASVSVVVDPCLGMDELTGTDAIRWLGQDSDGSHVFRITGVEVEGWEVYDATGRAISSGIRPIRNGLLRIPLGMERSGIYLIKLATGKGNIALRVVH